jgi:hypothetical protein
MTHQNQTLTTRPGYANVGEHILRAKAFALKIRSLPQFQQELAKLIGTPWEGDQKRARFLTMQRPDVAFTYEEEIRTIYPHGLFPSQAGVSSHPALPAIRRPVGRLKKITTISSSEDPFEILRAATAGL